MFVTAALAPRGPIEPRCICPKQLWKHIVLEVKAVWEALNFWTSSLQAQEVQILLHSGHLPAMPRGSWCCMEMRMYNKVDKVCL